MFLSCAGWRWKKFRDARHPTFWVCEEGCKSGCGSTLGVLVRARPGVSAHVMSGLQPLPARSFRQAPQGGRKKFEIIRFRCFCNNLSIQRRTASAPSLKTLTCRLTGPSMSTTTSPRRSANGRAMVRCHFHLLLILSGRRVQVTAC